MFWKTEFSTVSFINSMGQKWLFFIWWDWGFNLRLQTKIYYFKIFLTNIFSEKSHTYRNFVKNRIIVNTHVLFIIYYCSVFCFFFVSCHFLLLFIFVFSGFFLAALRFELRASLLLDRHSYYLGPSASHIFVFFASNFENYL
jgi:hypothetical protein